jgi:serine/threonine protein phosphatase 1
MAARTFAIGDIHGDLEALDTLLDRLPVLTEDDTLVFLGDYVDRGPDSRGVIQRVRELQRSSVAKVVALRGNHEDRWIASYLEPDRGFLLPRGNGCGNMFRSFIGGAPLADDEPISMQEAARFLDVRSWLPRDVVEWMCALPLWFENEHGLFVHAGLEGRGTHWKHPSVCNPEALLWMRRRDFFLGYRGKRLVFGHTAVDDLPNEHMEWAEGLFDDTLEVWFRGDLVGLDTACGKGGFLSAIELPSMRVFDSREPYRVLSEEQQALYNAAGGVGVDEAHAAVVEWDQMP